MSFAGCRAEDEDEDEDDEDEDEDEGEGEEDEEQAVTMLASWARPPPSISSSLPPRWSGNASSLSLSVKAALF